MKIVPLNDRFAQNPKSQRPATCLLCEAVSGESSGLLSGLERSHRVGNCQDSPLSGTSLKSAHTVRIVPKKTVRKKVQSILSPSREVQQQHPPELPVELSRQGGAMLDWVWDTLNSGYYFVRLVSLNILSLCLSMHVNIQSSLKNQSHIKTL